MTEVIYCDGNKNGNGPFEHPRVFLTFGEKIELSCPYCGRVFEKGEKKAQQK